MDTIAPQIQESNIDNTNHLGALTSHDLEIIPLKQFFALPIPSTEESSQLKWIHEYFQDLNTRSTIDMFLSIRNIESKLGMARLGETRLTRIYEYLKINRQLSDLEALRDSYHGR